MQHQTAHTDPRALLRKSQIIGGAGQQPLLPIKNTTFYALIQAGKFPAPKKIGRSSFWPAAEVFAAIEKLTAEG
ncbi:MULTISPECIES: AlpA family transcriptional regulator [unclassified Thiomonas]|nr:MULTISPECIES: Rha family transcriptional regulator [unclassified Thiomonas]VDY09531.1 putative Phage transcriptional regulator, AlpA [Thiomonas sp. Sup16B3]CDW95810.1 putative Phage transcriptional regulator, AlpA [Thiomonas sp. CB2]VDY03295.1 putative Phage transcriptional regulator, AlpA [Thiomonas sp. Bio17B3]VDY11544.1 putative Phage transcriptional regulator, AlpA [Thiomonas sp. OC7]VDY19242.1 putative Bacteriophage related protein [Thiomonas sp. CB2]